MNALTVRDVLIEHGKQLLAQHSAPVSFTGNPEADVLLNNIGHYPHAFVIACLMDRQYKAEKCWLIPHLVRQKLGSFEIGTLAGLSQEQVNDLMSNPEPLHRFPDVMAEIFHKAIQRIVTQYLGDASRIWKGCPSSATIVRRFLEFHGAGPKIAAMAANILVRDFKVPVSDKYSIDVSVDVQVRRVFRRLGVVRDSASNDEVIYAARELNPTYPGIFDLPAWEIGRNWCRPRNPECSKCLMQECCPTALQGQVGCASQVANLSATC